MSAGWVAAAVRARGLLHHRLGSAGIDQLEAAPTIEDAVGTLTATFYGRYVRRGMPLEQAERAVNATVLWHLRILAGWGPALSATSLRLLAGPFEIENIEDLFLRFAGVPAPAPFELGSLALSWPALASAGSAGDLRQRLARSIWGDPGGEDLGTVRLGLRLAWARQTADQLPSLRRLAASFAGLAVARAKAGGVGLQGRALDLAQRLLGSDLSLPQAAQDAAFSQTATSGELPADPSSPDPAQGHANGWDRRWAGEVAWWSEMAATGSKLAAESNPSESMVTGVVLLLAVDAWKVRGALEIAATRDAPRELADALA